MSSSWSSLWRDWDVLRRVAEDFRKLVRDLGIVLNENHKLETENAKRRQRAFREVKDKLLESRRRWPDSWTDLAARFDSSEIRRRIRWVLALWQKRAKYVLDENVQNRAGFEALWVIRKNLQHNIERRFLSVNWDYST